MSRDIVRQFKGDTGDQQLPDQEQQNTIVTLPWVHKLSTKLSRTLKNNGYKAVLKVQRT